MAVVCLWQTYRKRFRLFRCSELRQLTRLRRDKVKMLAWSVFVLTRNTAKWSVFFLVLLNRESKPYCKEHEEITAPLSFCIIRICRAVGCKNNLQNRPQMALDTTKIILTQLEPFWYNLNENAICQQVIFAGETRTMCCL